MLNVLSFDKLDAYTVFMQSVREWQAENLGKKTTEEYKEYWGLERFTGLHKAGFLKDNQFDAISRLYQALNFSPDKGIVTLYTRGGSWQDSQVYGPIIQWADKEQTSMVLNIGGEKLPLEVTQGTDAHENPQVWVKALLCDEAHGPLAPNWKALNTRNKQMKFRGDDGKDIMVDRLVGLLPVSPDRRTMVEIPFHPGADYYKSSSICQAFQTGDFKTFWETCRKELSIAGAGGQGGPIIDLNRVFRGRQRGELLREFVEKHKGLLIRCETFRYIPGDFPAWAFKVDLSTVIKLWGDEQVEGWGKKPKPVYYLSEVVWVSISASSKLTDGFDRLVPQPCIINVKGPNPKNYDYIPQVEVLPISCFKPDKQQKLFGTVFVPPAIEPTPIMPAIAAAPEIVPVDASTVF